MLKPIIKKQGEDVEHFIICQCLAYCSLFRTSLLVMLLSQCIGHYSVQFFFLSKLGFIFGSIIAEHIYRKEMKINISKFQQIRQKLHTNLNVKELFTMIIPCIYKLSWIILSPKESNFPLMKSRKFCKSFAFNSDNLKQYIFPIQYTALS